MTSIIVAGSTGAIGRELVIAAVACTRVRRVVALSRRALGESQWEATFGPELSLSLAREKLSVVAVDWEALASSDPASAFDRASTVAPSLLAEFQGHHVAAMCMGTTRKDAGSAEKFRRCDLDYVKVFLSLVRGASHSILSWFAQISSQGADKNSWFLYPQTKGEADEAAIAAQFPNTLILRPGLLERGDKARTVERCIAMLPFVPIMPVKSCALAILGAAFSASATISPLQRSSEEGGSSSGGKPALHIIGNDKIHQLAAVYASLPPLQQ